MAPAASSVPGVEFRHSCPMNVAADVVATVPLPCTYSPRPTPLGTDPKKNMLLNMADHGYPVAGYDNDPSKVEALRKESAGSNIHGVANITDFIGLLRSPRAVMMLVPAGPPVDSVIADLLPHLDKGDLIIDAGNSYFKDTDLRARNLATKGI